MSVHPTEMTPELAMHILSRLEAGESLAQICQGPSMPTLLTVLQWMESEVLSSSLLNRAKSTWRPFGDEEYGSHAVGF